jgi:hypothetical protein
MATTNQIEVKKYITPDIKKKMTKWEQEFITSIFNSKKDWTEKQTQVFNNIKKKYQLEERVVIERIIYAPIGYANKEFQPIMTRKMRKQLAIHRNINNNKTK